MALARALVVEPELLLLDEPFAASTAHARVAHADLARVLRAGPRDDGARHPRPRRGAGARRPRRVLIGGRICQIDETARVFQAPASEDVARFVGVETIVTGRVRSARRPASGGATRRAPARGRAPPARRASACASRIRPEDVTLAPAAEPPGASVRNRLPAVSSSVTPSPPGMRVVVDCGFPLVAAVHRGAPWSDLGSAPGARRDRGVQGERRPSASGASSSGPLLDTPPGCGVYKEITRNQRVAWTGGSYRRNGRSSSQRPHGRWLVFISWTSLPASARRLRRWTQDDTLIERLTAENEEFRRLRDEHQQLRRGAGDAQGNGPALGGPAMADQRAQEAEAHGQRPHGVDHPARARRRARLTARRSRLGRGTPPAGDGLPRPLPPLPRAATPAWWTSPPRPKPSARRSRAPSLHMQPATLRAIRAGNAPKGDVLGVARTAGILAAKRTPELIPLCHPLRHHRRGRRVRPDRARRGAARGGARAHRGQDRRGDGGAHRGQRGGLTVYDMVKAVEKGVTHPNASAREKSGGKSGHWNARP